MLRPCRVLPFVLLLGLAGCGSLRGPEPQNLVDQKLIGTDVGDFFARHGAPRTRTLEAGGRHGFDWESAPATFVDGPRTGATLRCSLHLTSAADGRILSAQIVGDMPGRKQLSYCVELLD